MGNGTSNGDHVYQLVELKIINGVVPNEKDCLHLKRAIDKENHEKAKWLLELLGIQQDSDKIIITRFMEAREKLKSMANNSILTSTTLDGHHSRTRHRMGANGLPRQCDEHTSNEMAQKPVDEDAELACSLSSNEPTKLRRFSKKIGRGFKTIFTKKK